MAEQVELAVSPRTVFGKAARRLRAQGIIPANIFGHGEPSEALQLAVLDFESLRRAHHATSVVALKIEGVAKTQSALVRHVQHEPVSGKILHIDFFRVNLRERITSKVPLHFIEDAPGVKLEGGVLLHLLETLDVECAAGDIVEFVEVDVSKMEHIGDMLHAKDITLPSNFTLVTDPEESVAKITAPRAERAEAASEATPAAAPAKAETPEA